jgi:glycosyltransferase involved in cell wall biosynthesis
VNGWGKARGSWKLNLSARTTGHSNWMMAKPLVSIMMPCFNAAVTLPQALSSLLAQTYDNWECVVVDDGSTDDSSALVEELGDRRMRLTRNAANMGRGVARQIALESARGEYLTFLDADDWLYPTKIEEQVWHLVRDPSIAVVSSPLAVMNQSGDLVGIRGRPKPDETSKATKFRGLRRPPFQLVASMTRMELAKLTGYCSELRRAQDLDFYLRLAANREYRITPNPLYSYREGSSITRSKLLSGLSYERRVFSRYLTTRPLDSSLRVAAISAKMQIYKLIFSAHMEREIEKRRTLPPTREEHNAFQRAKPFKRTTSAVTGEPLARSAPSDGGSA